MKILRGCIFKWIVLAVISFSTGCDKSPVPDPRIKELEAEIRKLKSGNKVLDAAKRAMRELKKIDSITEMDVDYAGYSKTLLETKPVFDEIVAELPEDVLKMSLSETMKAYVDGGKFWNLCLVNESFSDFHPKLKKFGYEEREYFKKYDIPWDDYFCADSSKVQVIWRFAAINLLAAEELIKKEAEKK